MSLYTKNQIKAMQKQALLDLVEFAGGRTYLSRMLVKPLPTINSWITRGMISNQGAKDVAKHETLGTEFTVKQLRPDL